MICFLLWPSHGPQTDPDLLPWNVLSSASGHVVLPPPAGIRGPGFVTGGLKTLCGARGRTVVLYSPRPSKRSGWGGRASMSDGTAEFSEDQTGGGKTSSMIRSRSDEP